MESKIKFTVPPRPDANPSSDSLKKEAVIEQIVAAIDCMIADHFDKRLAKLNNDADNVKEIDVRLGESKEWLVRLLQQLVL